MLLHVKARYRVRSRTPAWPAGTPPLRPALASQVWGLTGWASPGPGPCSASSHKGRGLPACFRAAQPLARQEAAAGTCPRLNRYPLPATRRGNWLIAFGDAIVGAISDGLPASLQALISFPLRSYPGAMRRRRDPHDDQALPTPRPAAPPVPTLGQLLHAPYWCWLRCNACDHCVAVALVPFVIRWGADAASDMLREHVRCAACGRRGATLQHPSWADGAVGWQPFPTAKRL